MRVELEFGGDQDPKSDYVKQEHGAQQLVGSGRSAFKFFPNENPPECADHGRALAQAIGKRCTSLGAGNDAEGHAKVPDDPSQNADSVKLQIAFGEVVGKGNRRPREGFYHHDAVPDEVGHQQPG
ncbi:hypothetical protein SDC9_202541 [bioreactor metagenome]|uniref:Uncharacterized protein n=1 Tax=bioreactor metagenome TaxID=1076179 RepID=A0A645J5W7_9ZZZZ